MEQKSRPLINPRSRSSRGKNEISSPSLTIFGLLFSRSHFSICSTFSCSSSFTFPTHLQIGRSELQFLARISSRAFEGALVRSSAHEWNMAQVEQGVSGTGNMERCNMRLRATPTSHLLAPCIFRRISSSYPLFSRSVPPRSRSANMDGRKRVKRELELFFRSSGRMSITWCSHFRSAKNGVVADYAAGKKRKERGIERETNRPHGSGSTIGRRRAMEQPFFYWNTRRGRGPYHSVNRWVSLPSLRKQTLAIWFFSCVPKSLNMPSTL